MKGIHLAIVDDHIMFRQGLAAAISSIEHMEVSMENSKPLQSKVEVIYGVWTEKIFLSP
ncbi:MAG: hypothetical protein HQ500_00930 [Flavobacteriales bacterium]|nr:hypothetical protein [Flavobacteriales bacterium]